MGSRVVARPWAGRRAADARKGATLCGAAGGQPWGSVCAAFWGAAARAAHLWAAVRPARTFVLAVARVLTESGSVGKLEGTERNPRAPARTIRRTVRVLPPNVRRHGSPSATEKIQAENPRATNSHALRNSEPGRSVLTSLAETSTSSNRCGGSGASMTSGMRPSRSARPAPSSRNVAGARQARRSRRWRGRSIIRDASITRCVDCSPRARPGELSRPPSSPL